MRDDDLIDRLLAQLPAPYPLATGRSGNETLLPSVRRERTEVAPMLESFTTLRSPNRDSSSELEPGEIASTPTADSSPLNVGQKGSLAICPAPRQVDIIKEPSGIRNPLSPAVGSRVLAGPKPAPGIPQDRFKNSVLTNPSVGPRTSLAPGSWGGSQLVFRSHVGNTFFSQSHERVRDDVHGGFGRLQAPGKTNTKVATVAVAKSSAGSSGRTDSQTLQSRNTTASRPSTNNPVGNVPKGPKKDQPQVSSAPVASVCFDANAKQKLSSRCQSRGFNPEWVSKGISGSKCSYNVKLRDVIIESDGWYVDGQTAKAAVATKALNDAELWAKWPKLPKRSARPPALSKASTTDHANRSSAISTNTSRPNTSHRNLFLVKREPGSSDVGVNRTADESERLKLLVLLQKYIGPSVPNYTDKPDICNAFFEGLAMGACLTRPSQSPAKQTLPDRARSRSPPTRPSGSSANYRARSPLGARLRLTPPPVYQHYPGRPSSSHYSPRTTPLREPPRGPASMFRGNMVVKKE